MRLFEVSDTIALIWDHNIGHGRGPTVSSRESRLAVNTIIKLYLLYSILSSVVQPICLLGIQQFRIATRAGHNRGLQCRDSTAVPSQ